MGPAIALRLRQHLTLTPQVQQALRLLQMSGAGVRAGDGAGARRQPVPRGKPRRPGAARSAEKRGATVEEVVLPQDAPPSSGDREPATRTTGAAPPTRAAHLQEHLREQLRMSRIGERDRALAEMVIDSLDDDGYFKASFEELAALLPKEHDVLPEEFAAALKLVQSLDPAGIARAHARGVPVPAAAGAARGHARAARWRSRSATATSPLLANREWARLQHARRLQRAMRCTPRAR